MNTQTSHEVLKAVATLYQQHHCNAARAARESGVPRATFFDRLKKARQAGLVHDGTTADQPAGKLAFTYTPLPEPDISVEELIEHRIKQFSRKKAHEDARRLIKVKIHTKGPIGIWHFGDPHCLTTDHEILTKRGWLKHDDLILGDEVGGVLAVDGSFAWQPIERIIDKPVHEEISIIDTCSISLSCTIDHKVIAAKAISKGYEPVTEYTAKELTDSQFKIPVSAWTPSMTEFPISDDHIRLLAWLFTDTNWSVTQGTIKAFNISQSKPKTIAMLESVLGNCGIRPSIYERHRSGGHTINGRTVTHNYPERCYRIGLQETQSLTDLYGLSADAEFPQIAWEFSTRQFDIFLDSVVDADGNRVSKNTVRVYSGYAFLEALQALCCAHGQKTRLYRSHPTWGMLSMTKKSFAVTKPKYDISYRMHSGTVWCVTVPHGNFFTRHNGMVHLTGNCDDDGTDLGLLREHANIIKNTDGLFGANVGDSSNNWVGRLSHLWGQQSTSARQMWSLVDWFIGKVNWLYLISGNHDAWSGEGDPIKWMMKGQEAPYQSSEVRLELCFPNKNTCRINARHDFSGHSQYNPVHGPMKANMFGARDHIAVAGHRHVSGHGVLKNPDDGSLCHSFLVAGYKIYDRYAMEKGFRDQRISPGVFTIINPEVPNTHPDFILHCWDIETGVFLLKALRKRYA